MRRVEPLEQAARMEPVLARPARLGGQRPICQRNDAVALDCQLKRYQSAHDSTLDNTVKV